MRLSRMIEAVLFASEAPLTPADLARIDSTLDEQQVETIIAELKQEYEAEERAFGIFEIAGGFQILTRPEYAPVAASLAEVGFYSASQLMATFAAKKPEIDPWIADAQLNRDRNLRLQFLAGMGMNLYVADAIYRDMARYRTYPTGLFTGSPERIQLLQRYWESEGE